MSNLESEQKTTKEEVQSLRKKIDLMVNEKEKIEGKLEELRAENAKLDFFTKQLGNRGLVKLVLNALIVVVLDLLNKMEQCLADVEMLNQAAEADVKGDLDMAMVFYFELSKVMEIIGRAQAVRNDSKSFFELAVTYYQEAIFRLDSLLFMGNKISNVFNRKRLQILRRIDDALKRVDELQVYSGVEKENYQGRTSGIMEGLTAKEVQILKLSSTINEKTYVPWLSIDLKENFWAKETYMDQDGKLELSPKQLTNFGGWKRPHEFMKSPRVVRVISCNNICQDVVTDCSFVASLCVSAAYELRFKKQLITNCIFPQDKNGVPIYNPFGNNMNELWPSIIEKAYMKLMGGYAFPGSPQFDRDLQWIRMLEGHKHGDGLITVATGAMTQELSSDLGLVPTHASRSKRSAFSPSDHLNWSDKLKEELNFDHHCALQPATCIYPDSLRNPELFRYRHVMHINWPLKHLDDGYSSLSENPQYGLEIDSSSGGSLVWLLLSKHSLRTVLIMFSNNTKCFVTEVGKSRYTVIVNQHQRSRALAFTLRVYATSPFLLGPLPKMFGYEKIPSSSDGIYKHVQIKGTWSANQTVSTFFLKDLRAESDHIRLSFSTTDPSSSLGVSLETRNDSSALTSLQLRYDSDTVSEAWTSGPQKKGSCFVSIQSRCPPRLFVQWNIQADKDNVPFKLVIRSSRNFKVTIE
ncbi:hypothetical protein BC829DRAFT_422277 [Chytridium lagenaria]|nr:hypothetical protein BC829DRAFT_422277 [Chytridium lagenaria]